MQLITVQPDLMIIYVSRAAFEMGADELKSLTDGSARRNKEKNITGGLIKVGNYFIQVLEGPETLVKELMNKITTDPRHCEVRVLYKETVQSRIFAEWITGYLNLDEQYVVSLKDYRQLRELVHKVMSMETVGKDSIMGIIKGFSLLLQKHKAAA